MFGNDKGLKPIDQDRQSIKVVGQRRFGRPKRHAYPVQGQGVMASDGFQVSERRAARNHVVLGMNLEPVHWRGGVQYLLVELCLEADATALGHRPVRGNC